MKKIIILGASALMASVGMGLNPTTSNTEKTETERSVNANNKSNQNQTPQNQNLASEGKSTYKIESNKGYSRVFYNIGIPPKVYGMKYVKRGTHKRTNI